MAKAIYDLRGCKTTWIAFVPVKEMFECETVREGVVQVFNLEGHQKAIHCYAWSNALSDSNKRRFFAVLHEGAIDSPEKAVQAVIVDEFRKNSKENL